MDRTSTWSRCWAVQDRTQVRKVNLWILLLAAVRDAACVTGKRSGTPLTFSGRTGRAYKASPKTDEVLDVLGHL